MLEHRVSALIEASHPCLPGHFPGQPVVPAVLLMEQVLDAVLAWRGLWQLRRLLSTKFLLPLLPEQRFEILLRMDGTRLDFRCERDAELLALGRWELEETGGSPQTAPP